MPPISGATTRAFWFDWGFPLFLLFMLGVVLAPHLAGQREQAPTDAPAETQA